MKPDIVLKEHVLDELEWEPGIKAAGIGVAVKDGVVTLSGEVESYHEKIEAERAALRVAGVKGMVSAIEVQLPGASQRSDADVARTAVHAVEWNSSIPPDCIKVLVDKGWITLEGEVDWGYQRTAAEETVRRLTGVRGVWNLVKVRSRGRVRLRSRRRSRTRSGAARRWTRIASVWSSTAAQSPCGARCAHGRRSKRPSAWRGRHPASRASRTSSCSATERAWTARWMPWTSSRLRARWFPPEEGSWRPTRAIPRSPSASRPSASRTPWRAAGCTGRRCSRRRTSPTSSAVSSSSTRPFARRPTTARRSPSSWSGGGSFLASRSTRGRNRSPARRAKWPPRGSTGFASGSASTRRSGRASRSGAR